MKEFRAVTVVKWPREEVFATVRDHLPALAAHLDDIHSVTVESREEHPDGTTRLVNRWRAATAVPPVLAPIVGAEGVAWTDVASWSPRSWTCAWEIQPHFARQASECTGVTRYEPAMGGRGTRITIEGQVSVRGGGLPGAARLLGQTSRGVEGFVTELVPRNFQKLGRAVSALLAGEPPPGG